MFRSFLTKILVRDLKIEIAGVMAAPMGPWKQWWGRFQGGLSLS